MNKRIGRIVLAKIACRYNSSVTGKVFLFTGTSLIRNSTVSSNIKRDVFMDAYNGDVIIESRK